MPIVQRLMDALTSRYGQKQGEDAYYAMEMSGKGPFGPRGKYHALHQAKAHEQGAPAIEQPRTNRRPTASGSSSSRHGKAPSPMHKHRRTGPPKR